MRHPRAPKPFPVYDRRSTRRESTGQAVLEPVPGPSREEWDEAEREPLSVPEHLRGLWKVLGLGD
jgi:hypothetical protein